MAHFALQDVSFRYPGAERCALQHIQLAVEPGEFVVLCGQSGSGKTTLLRQLKPLLAPHGQRSGSILFRGQPLEGYSQREQAARIGFLFQDPDEQLVTDKVWHELAFGLESLGCDPATMRPRVAEMASYFGIQSWFEADTASLSGGQKQLVNLAAVMAVQPEVLLLDEPTSQLDPIAAGNFLNTLRRIHQELGVTILLTEHRLEEVFPLADRVVVLDGGAIAAAGTPRQVCAALLQQKHPMAAALPAPAQLAASLPSAADPCPLTVGEGRALLRQRLCGKPLGVTALPEPETKAAPTALELRQVWFRYERQGPDVLKGFSLTLEQGQLLALVGGNGAGKSTALRVAGGVCPPYRGKVLLGGKPLSAYKADGLYRGGLALLPQDPRSLFVKQTVREELAEMAPAGPEAAAALNEVAALCELTSLLECHPYDLSGGEQQRAALAKVLLTQPRVLLLDEPTKGMDSAFKARFAALLRRLKSQGVAILLVSHDIEFCAAYADQVGMVFDGQLLAQNTARGFFAANYFYTTSASRMSREFFRNAITAADIAALLGQNEL